MAIPDATTQKIAIRKASSARFSNLPSEEEVSIAEFRGGEDRLELQEASHREHADRARLERVQASFEGTIDAALVVQLGAFRDIGFGPVTPASLRELHAVLEVARGPDQVRERV